MHFTTDQRDNKTIFRLKEERLDSRNAGQLKAEFLILAQPETNVLIVDLSDVHEVDSAGLSALLLGQRQMRLVGGELRLTGLSESVRKLLSLTQLDRMFPIYGTVSEAMKAKPGFFPNSEGSFMDLEDEEEEAEGRDEMLRGPSDISDATEWGNIAGRNNAFERIDYSEPLGPGAPSAKAIRAGAIAAGGSFGAAALTNIMMTSENFEFEDVNLLGLGDDEDLDEEDNDLDDIDDLEQDFSDEDEDEDDFDEEDDLEEDEDEEEEPSEAVDDLDEDFEDDDWDEEELEEDEEEDY